MKFFYLFLLLQLILQCTIDPDGWMTLPLDKRWMPPLKVIQAFESEGFIWGGKWPVWDNMHFEYRPELIEYTRAMPE